MDQLSLLSPRGSDQSQQGEHQRHIVSFDLYSLYFLIHLTSDDTDLSLYSTAAVCCCLFGGICCAFLPFCMEMCHDSHHFCTHCGAQVAIHPHEGPVQQFGPNLPGPITQAPGRIQPPQPVMKN
jgi:hypothetical protein